ncbi:MAG TPA: winged helix-turn-helix domain-containing protein [Actinomycetota bacterium]|nr:winged helix-turn-helix domain-containing protein [Actinomycetota bacterium]
MGAGLTSAELSAADARAIALRAQGFLQPRPARVDLRGLRRFVDRVKVVQMDSVNVLVRAHYFPAFSRLGPYANEQLDAMAYKRRELFEYWGHEASLMPVELYPLMRARMEAAKRGELWRGIARFADENKKYIDAVLGEVRDRGPLAASDLSEKGARSEKWWGWAPGKSALEWLFWTGALTTASRRNFERVYDLPERVIPADVLGAQAPGEEESNRRLLDMSIVALGVATARDLADYFRIKVPDARSRIGELVEEGRLQPAIVEGWKDEAFVDPAAKVPRHAEARALVAPFDPIVWERARTHRLFDFHYRIEIYTPAQKRVHGYYVVPFLLGDTLVARVDLKADRKAKVLLVHAAFAEAGRDPSAIAEPLAAELQDLARWLGLEKIRTGSRGNLARALRAALRRVG